MNNQNTLKKIIIEKIRKEGPISFKDFMEMCLYHPLYGYYSKRHLAIGKMGDFVTSPHASRLFGSLLAVQLVECLEFIEKKDSYQLCEIGPGEGYLTKDILDFMSKHYPNFFDSVKLYLVEPLSERRKILKKRFDDFEDKVFIIETIEELSDFHGIMYANELLDAFPVHVIEKKSNHFMEIFIDSDGIELFETYVEIRDKNIRNFIEKYLGNLSQIPDGYRTEINLQVIKWLTGFSKIFSKGYVIFIDYGFNNEEYYAPFRNRGTLLGYEGQKISEDFFLSPGEMDITSHVNFTVVKRCLESQGFKIEGYCPQWAFLGSLDFEKTLKKVYGNIEPFSPELASIKSLIFPQGMGQSHKVLIASKNVEDRPLKGFKMANYADRL